MSAKHVVISGPRTKPLFSPVKCLDIHRYSFHYKTECWVLDLYMNWISQWFQSKKNFLKLVEFIIKSPVCHKLSKFHEYVDRNLSWKVWVAVLVNINVLILTIWMCVCWSEFKKIEIPFNISSSCLLIPDPQHGTRNSLIASMILVHFINAFKFRFVSTPVLTYQLNLGLQQRVSSSLFCSTAVTVLLSALHFFFGI
jgi:hypothetical protein